MFGNPLWISTSSKNIISVIPKELFVYIFLRFRTTCKSIFFRLLAFFSWHRENIQHSLGIQKKSRHCADTHSHKNARNISTLHHASAVWKIVSHDINVLRILYNNIDVLSVFISTKKSPAGSGLLIMPATRISSRHFMPVYKSPACTACRYTNPQLALHAGTTFHYWLCCAGWNFWCGSNRYGAGLGARQKIWYISYYT